MEKPLPFLNKLLERTERRSHFWSV